MFILLALLEMCLKMLAHSSRTFRFLADRAYGDRREFLFTDAWHMMVGNDVTHGMCQTSACHAKNALYSFPMPRPSHIMSVKAFFDALEEKLKHCSREDLLLIIRNSARIVAPPEREKFLNELLPTDTGAAHVPDMFHTGNLLADIDDLIKEIEHTQENADEWEQEHYGFYDGYDDEDSLGPYEDCIVNFEMLFDRTRGVFDCGDFALVRQAYVKLFEALGMQDDYGRGISVHDLEETAIDEECSRYLRSVYETAEPAQRVHILWKELAHVRELIMRRPPPLKDVMNVTTKPFPDKAEFLRQWTRFLQTEKGKRADAYLREAILLAEGIDGMASFAREHGRDHTRAYLDWVTSLARSDKYDQVVTVAREALNVLPEDLPLRAAIADELYGAAQYLHDEPIMREARLTAFNAKPELRRLLELRESIPQSERTQRMNEAAEHIVAYRRQRQQETREPMPISEQDDDIERKVDVSEDVLAHALLFAQDWEGAKQLAQTQKETLGWTSGWNPQSIVVPAFLYLLAGNREKLPANLDRLWNDALENGCGWSCDDRENLKRRLVKAYGDLATEAAFTSEEWKTLLQWCMTMARKRTAAIVGEQYRKSYDKAARVVCACADVLRIAGREQDAAAFPETVRLDFPRHASFQKELRAAVSLSTPRPQEA